MASTTQIPAGRNSDLERGATRPSPLPWNVHVNERSEDGKYAERQIRDASGARVATVFYVGPKGKADAEHLVRCVNEHDDMLAALHAALDEVCNYTDADAARCAAVIRAAISRATQPS